MSFHALNHDDKRNNFLLCLWRLTSLKSVVKLWEFLVDITKIVLLWLKPREHLWRDTTKTCTEPTYHNLDLADRAPSQYPKRRLFARSREVSKPRDWYFKLPYRFEIWQAHRQQCCRSACQIAERSDNSKYKSRGFETLRDLTKRRLFGYWDGSLGSRTEEWMPSSRLIYVDKSLIQLNVNP